MSDIHGVGYGSGHNWKRGDTANVGSWGTKCTTWKCMDCNQEFNHYYDDCPDIFEAIKDAGITQVCPQVH